ncbi:MAG: hypothetical protein KBS64_07415 [Treponema sp.]|nr:hypothetical protein [Candidatus Treponema equi]
MKKKKIIIIASAIVLAAAIALTCILLAVRKSNRTIKVVFYNLPESHVGAITEILDRHDKLNEDFSFVYIKLDQDRPLDAQAKKTDIVFTYMGLAADKAVASLGEKNMELAAFDQSFLAGTSMTSASLAMEKPGVKEGKPSQVPLLYDGYELLLSISSMSRAQMEMISSWNDLETFARKSKDTCVSGFAFAGADADSLLGFITAMVEAFDGSEACDLVAKTISEHTGSMDGILEYLAKEGQPLNETMNRLARWKKEGLLNTEVLSFDKDTLIEVAEKYNTAVLIMPLSEHRRISSTMAKYYTTLPIHTNETSFYFPSMRWMNTRALVSPVTAMISMTKDNAKKEAVKTLVLTDSQEYISRKSGIAPTLANCRITDMQADDIRFWIAATSKPVMPLGLSAFDDKAKKEEFAQAVRNYIIKN